MRLVSLNARPEDRFYADQRENRQFISRISDGQKVLDICCFSGGFALNVVRGGALNVTDLALIIVHYYGFLSEEHNKEKFTPLNVLATRPSAFKTNLDLEVVFQLIRLKSWYILCDQITRHQHQPNSHFPLVQCSSTSKVGEVDFNKGQIKNRASHNRGGCMARVGWKMRIRLMLVTSDGSSPLQ
ncbi:hypothetical protein JHK87_010425 [Glycine soja]|nr:hypothetical protein JHK87_010425 [Glycine soja]